MGRRSGEEIAQTEGARCREKRNREKWWEEEEETGHGGLFENKCLLPAPHEIIEADSLPSPPIKLL